jgi:hypothetical protein
MVRSAIADHTSMNAAGARMTTASLARRWKPSAATK